MPECTDAADWLVEADVEEFLGETVSADLAAALIAAAQNAVRNYTGQCLTLVEDDVIYVDGTGRDAFRLPQRPVVAVTEIQEDGDVVDPGVWPDHEWMFRAGSGTVMRQAIWPVGRDNLQVTYDHGYDPDPVYGNFPADLRLVSLTFMRRVFGTWGTAAASSASAKKSETMGDYSYTLFDEVSAAASATSFAITEKSVLDRFRAGGPKAGSKL